MKKTRFTEPQIMAVLREAESGVAVPAVCRTHGISTASRSRSACMLRSANMRFSRRFHRRENSLPDGFLILLCLYRLHLAHHGGVHPAILRAPFVK